LNSPFRNSMGDWGGTGLAMHSGAVFGDASHRG